jgi:hypothetical protein
VQIAKLSAGLDAVVTCRTALAWSYVEAYYMDSDSAIASHLFSHIQGNLELYTNHLQDMLNTALDSVTTELAAGCKPSELVREVASYTHTILKFLDRVNKALTQKGLLAV